jgi:VWFA-related protein
MSVSFRVSSECREKTSFYVSACAKLSMSYLVLPGIVFLYTGTVHAQQQSPPSPETLQVNVTQVSLSVVVTDTHGHPIHNLAAGQFQMFDNGILQHLKHFEECATDPLRAAQRNDVNLPPNTFSNYLSPSANGSVDVLLVDALNTPLDDQAYLRSQLIAYLKHTPIGQPIAVFGLNTRLSLLQSFTSDRELLITSLEHKSLGTSPLLSTAGATAGLSAANPLGAQSGPPAMTQTVGVAPSATGANAAELESIRGGIADLEAEQASVQTQLRVRLTLEALTALGRYLAAIPGRKNLLWFSGSFPSVIAPGLESGSLAGSTSLVGELQQAIDLMATSQIAIYPIDPRGLPVSPMSEAAQGGSHSTRTVGRDAATNRDFFADQNNEHDTMDTIARSTGGRAFYDNNDLAAAAASAIEDGASYYTLGYTPSGETKRSPLHKLTVKIVGPSQRMSLNYRRSYFVDPSAASNPETDAFISTSSTIQRAMMLHAIESTQIVVEVKVTPQVPGATSKDAPDSRTLNIEIGVDPHGLSFSNLLDGTYGDKLEFATLAYDTDGKILRSQVNRLAVNLRPEGYRLMGKTGLRYDQIVTVPFGRTAFFKVGVRELDTGHMGTVEISNQGIKGPP